MSKETVFRILFWILLFLVFVMRGYFAVRVRRAGERLMPDRQAIRREGWGMFMVRFVGFFLLMGWLVLYGIYPSWMDNLLFPLPGWLRWIGFILGLASLGFWTWTQVELDTHWSAQLQLREEHAIVSSGPYARMRHPLYTAMFFWTVSLALVTASWVFAGMVVLVALIFFTRVPREEAMMLEQFGDEYRSYIQRTGKFLPRLFKN